MHIRVPSMLTSYTEGKKKVTATGETLIEVLEDLDTRYPGIKFRFINEKGKIREHMRIFVNREPVENLKLRINEGDEIFITQSLSGGVE